MRIKKVLSSILILALAMSLCVCFAACNDSQQVEEFGNIEYKTILKNYLEYPDSANSQKMSEIERNVEEIFNDTSLTDGQKVAQMMERATNNEIECAYFAYFRNQMGETKIGNNHGQLIYQRLRRQSDTIKDDTTIKLPVNHNFDAIASRFVTSAKIRYVNEYGLNKMTNDSKIIYDEESGLLTVSNWKKDDKWNHSETAIQSRSYEEARKTCVNWNAENIVDGNKPISLAVKTDNKGNEYYELKFSIDIAVANADKTTIDRLEQDNGGKNMKYEYCDFVIEIWKNGLAKRYQISESWSGKIGGIYSGSAQSKSEIVFSYSEADLDYSNTDAIFQSLN